jgi:hypothetical protein
MIGEVRLNGEVYSEAIPHEAIEVGRSEIEVLDIITRSPEEIARHFLKNGPHLINALLGALPRINEMFRLGDEAEANEHYLRFLESLHLLASMLEKVASVIGVKPDLPIHERESFNDHLRKLAETLTQLLDVQEQTDWIFLADLLEYELTPELEALVVLLPKLDDAF